MFSSFVLFFLFAGIVFSALVHAWDSGSHVDADVELKKMVVNGEEHMVKYVKVKGAIFFSSISKFVNMFSVTEDPNLIIIDFEYALIIDHSAVAAIQGITQRFAKVGKKVLLVNLGKKSHGRLHRTGDHEVLKSQITPAAHLDHNPSSTYEKDVEGEPVPNPGTSPGTPRTDHAAPGDDQNKDDNHLYDEGSHLLENLDMFNPGVDEISVEVDLLGRLQEDFSIHEKKEN